MDIFTRWEDRNLEEEVNMGFNVKTVHIKAGPKKIIPKEDLFPFMDEFTKNLARYIK